MHQLLGELRPEWMFLAGCALLTTVLVRRSYRRLGRRGRSGRETPLAQLPRPAAGWDGAYKDLSAHLSRQSVELFDLERETTGKIDSKILVLEQLIATSEQQIQRLEQLLDRLEHAAPQP